MNNMAHGIAAGILIGTGVFTVAADQAAVTPPQTSALLLELFADGVQIYTCEAKESRFQWSFKAPEANLFDKQGRQVGTHFAGPTWKMDGGSVVVGEVISRADAPEPGAIQWLLLRAKGLPEVLEIIKERLQTGQGRRWGGRRPSPSARTPGRRPRAPRLRVG